MTYGRNKRDTGTLQDIPCGGLCIAAAGIFEYAVDPETLDHWNGVLVDIHDRIKTWFIYHDGNLIYAKVTTFLLICITCVGTRNKKHLEMDAQKQVLYPLLGGVGLVILSVWLFGFSIMPRIYTLKVNIWLYMILSVIGAVLIHVALDNISKFLKDGLLKDRFNFENESFEQATEAVENKYSVNIPMRFYYKGKFRRGACRCPILSEAPGSWVLQVRVRHSLSSSRSSGSTPQRVSLWLYMITSSLP